MNESFNVTLSVFSSLAGWDDSHADEEARQTAESLGTDAEHLREHRPHPSAHPAGAKRRQQGTHTHTHTINNVCPPAASNVLGALSPPSRLAFPWSLTGSRAFRSVLHVTSLTWLPTPPSSSTSLCRRRPERGGRTTASNSLSSTSATRM